uniref:Uncharacterized protein n=1 Tax=Mycena chlorophos TaxID=658473 RepID=A0ABQ0LTC3_MYCCL|nr:predicted protein [Mycena chlorophos]
MAAISISLSLPISGSSVASSSAASSASSGGGGGGGGGGGNNSTLSNGSSASQTGSSASQASSTPIVLSSPSVTVGQSTFLSTSNGQVVTDTVKVTSTIPAGATITPPSAPSNNSSSHAGAIAGGVVGGIAALLILVFLIWFLRKRAKERHEAELFDGNFDPSKTTNPTLPRVSNAAGEAGTPMAEYEDDGVGGRLAASTVGGGVVTPFMTGLGAGAAAGHVAPQGYYDQGHNPQHHQQQAYYGGAGGYDDRALSPTTASSSNYYYNAGASSTASAYPASVTSASTGYPNPMSAKEREARGMSVANPNPNQPGPSHLPNPHSPDEGGVVVHTDGGRAPEDEGMREIPPTYDSISS